MSINRFMYIEITRKNKDSSFAKNLHFKKIQNRYLSAPKRFNFPMIENGNSLESSHHFDGVKKVMIIKTPTKTKINTRLHFLQFYKKRRENLYNTILRMDSLKSSRFKSPSNFAKKSFRPMDLIKNISSDSIPKLPTIKIARSILKDEIL